MAESLVKQWSTQLHTLPSGRQVRLQRFNLQEAAKLLGDLAEPMAQAAGAPAELQVLVAREMEKDPEQLLRVITFMLQRGVAEPRIVPKTGLADLADNEIRFQDVGQDLAELLMAIARFNELPIPEEGAATEVM